MYIVCVYVGVCVRLCGCGCVRVCVPTSPEKQDGCYVRMYECMCMYWSSIGYIGYWSNYQPYPNYPYCYYQPNHTVHLLLPFFPFSPFPFSLFPFSLSPFPLFTFSLLFPSPPLPFPSPSPPLSHFPLLVYIYQWRNVVTKAPAIVRRVNVSVSRDTMD